MIIMTTMAYPVIPVPEPVDMKGNTYNNWTFFRAQWENYEIATGLDKNKAKVCIVTLLTVMGKEYNLFICLKQTTDQVKIIEALQKHFEPSRNMIYERYMYNVCQKYQCETTTEQY